MEVLGKVSVALSSQKIGFGEPVLCKIVTSSEIESFVVKISGKKFKIFLHKKTKDQYEYKTYVAIDRYSGAGNYILNIKLKLKDQSRFYQNYKIGLNYFPEKVGVVKLTKNSKKLSQNRKLLKKELELIEKKVSLLTNVSYVDGLFDFPAIGRLSSSFGKKRRYNNGRVNLHSGLDISNKIGTPVVAPQHGQVILSESFKYHGNTVLIDHGYGLVSIYCHLHERHVKDGEFLKKGQLLGAIGKTGTVSGPHLHWGMSVQSVRVNPEYFIRSDKLL